MTVLKILTYNVCWECISGSNKGSSIIYANKCSKTKKINNKNLCYRNVANIASYKKFDIIGLQEGNLGLAKNIIKKLGNNYKIIFSKSCKEHSIIIYNSSKLKKTGKVISGQLEECGRAFLYQKFVDLKNNEIIVGNFHGPHLEYDWITKYIFKLNKLVNNTSKIIIFGDFNKEFKNKVFKLKKTRKSIKPINLDINTCSDKLNFSPINEKRYNQKIDNILLSSNIKIIHGPETINNISNILLPKDTNYKLANYSSDHRPIAAQIKF